MLEIKKDFYLLKNLLYYESTYFYIKNVYHEEEFFIIHTRFTPSIIYNYKVIYNQRFTRSYLAINCYTFEAVCNFVI